MLKFKSIGQLLTVVAAMGLGSVALVGCEQEGPMERAGENIDDATRDLGRGMDDAGDNMRDAVD